MGWTSVQIGPDNVLYRYMDCKGTFRSICLLSEHERYDKDIQTISHRIASISTQAHSEMLPRLSTKLLDYPKEFCPCQV